MKRWRWRLFWSAAVALVLLGAGSWIAGGMMLASTNHAVGALPDDLPGRSVSFASRSGATIHGWLLPGTAGGGAVVLMHGVRDTRLGMLDRARFLHAAGYTVLLFDFRAHGESIGEHITFGYLESRDAQAAVNFLRTSAPSERVGLLGNSMGGAAALLAAPALDVDAIVIEMVYPTMEDAITNRFSSHLGGWASVLTPLLSWQLAPRLHITLDSLRPIDRIGSVRAPIFVIGGAEDHYTPAEETRHMAAAAGEMTEVWLVPGAGHENLCDVGGTEYQHRVLDFFERHLRSGEH